MKTAWETAVKFVLFYVYYLLIVIVTSALCGILLKIPIIGKIVLFCLFSSDMQPRWTTVTSSALIAFVLMVIVSSKLFHDPTTNSDKWFSIVLIAYGVFVLITKIINGGHIRVSLQFIFVGIISLALLKSGKNTFFK